MCMPTVLDPENDIDTVVASNVSPRDVISPPDTHRLRQRSNANVGEKGYRGFRRDTNFHHGGHASH